MLPLTRIAHIVRAILLASATAATLCGRRAINDTTQPGNFEPLRACFRIDVAPTISSVRNCLFPRFEILPSRSSLCWSCSSGYFPLWKPARQHRHNCIKTDGVERPFAPASKMPIVATPIATRQEEPFHGEDYHNRTGFGQVGLSDAITKGGHLAVRRDDQPWAYFRILLAVWRIRQLRVTISWLLPARWSGRSIIGRHRPRG